MNEALAKFGYVDMTDEQIEGWVKNCLNGEKPRGEAMWFVHGFLRDAGFEVFGD